jgi:Ca2+/Na+ antiporter
VRKREGKKVIRIILFSLFGILALSFFDPAAAAISTVTNINDNGPGSLRQAIINATPGILSALVSPALLRSPVESC